MNLEVFKQNNSMMAAMHWANDKGWLYAATRTLGDITYQDWVAPTGIIVCFAFRNGNVLSVAQMVTEDE